MYEYEYQYSKYRTFLPEAGNHYRAVVKYWSSHTQLQGRVGVDIITPESPAVWLQYLPTTTHNGTPNTLARHATTQVHSNFAKWTKLKYSLILDELC